MGRQTRYTVVGASYGGKIMAAHLALMGYPVTLLDLVDAHVAAIRARGGIQLASAGDALPQGFGRLHMLTSDVQQALADADVVMVVLPALAHREIAQAAAPYLRDGQIVVLHPGRACGAIEFAHVLREQGCTAGVTVAEAGALLYAGRSDGPAEARLFHIQEVVPFAALPATRTARVLGLLHPAFPQFIDGQSVLHTALGSVRAIFNPTLTLLNGGRVESARGDYHQYFIESVTPSVVDVLAALDQERAALAARLEVQTENVHNWLGLAHNVPASGLSEAIHDHPGYYTEDVPMSLVPMALLGQQFGIQMRGMRAIVNLASVVHGEDYWRTGRTLEKLGLQGMSIVGLRDFVAHGSS